MRGPRLQMSAAPPTDVFSPGTFRARSLWLVPCDANKPQDAIVRTNIGRHLLKYMSKTLHTTQLLLDVDQSIDHSLDGLFVELHLNAFDACGRKKIQRFATEVTHANRNAVSTHL